MSQKSRAQLKAYLETNDIPTQAQYVDIIDSIPNFVDDNYTLPTFAVGTTTTLAAGEDATVVNSGTGSAAVLDFGIPEGEKGDKGDQGIQGIQGPNGNAATATAGTTTTLAAGQSAAVTNVGTTSDAIFNFAIPRGDKGEEGACVVSVSFVGNDMVFVLDDSSTITLTNAKVDLKGDQGIQGIQGITGAKIVSGAFVGDDLVFTLDDNSTATVTGAKTDLQGIQGIQGIQGVAGNGITNISLISTVGLVKTYRITYTDNTTFDYTVTDGANGTGTGDMLKSTYDPANGSRQVAFADSVVPYTGATTNLSLGSHNLDLNNTTFTSQTGVITKNGYRFIHDFNYGNNGTVTTSGQNTFLGINAGNFTMGSTATIVGQASYNTGVGVNSLTSNTTGSQNTANGYASLYSNTTGNQNTALGFNSGRYIADKSTGALNSNNSVFLGYRTSPLADNQTNQIVIGYDATGNGSNTITLGNSSVTATYLGGSTASSVLYAGGIESNKGGIFFGQYGTFPTGLGTYVANYVSSTYGARVLAYDGTNYQTLKLGKLISGSTFQLALNADGTSVFGGTVSASTFIGALTGTASGNLTSSSTLDASKLSGTIPTGVLGNSSLYIGTTAVVLNRASASLALTGIASIDGTATNLSGTPALPNGTTATTQTAGDNSTKLATTAYVDSKASGASLWTAITGTRASNTTITVATDKTAIFKKGMIVRWQESGVDKAGMVSIPSTYS